MGADNLFKPLRQGLLEFAVLTTLSTGRHYAGDVVERLAETPFATREGTLYPLLSKMRRDGLFDHEWEESGSGPPRKYYRVTESGSERLVQLSAYWRKLDDALTELGATG
jgi:PadR family transcriptional regulator PadR